MRRFIFGAAVAAAFASAASAHDFFLLPAQFTTAGAGTVNIQATVGSSFPTPEVVVTTDRVDQLFAAGSGNPRVRIAGAGAKALNLEATGARPGLLVAAVRSKPRDVEYGEDRIPLILGEYRVSPEAAAAVERLQRPRTWRVSSRRFAKTFVCVRTCAKASVGDRALGAPLEFVGRGPTARYFRLLGAGRPLANYPVDLVGSDGKRQHLSTDARGRVRLPAAAKGPLMLFAAHLEPPASGERFTLHLTSLTFHRS